MTLIWSAPPRYVVRCSVCRRAAATHEVEFTHEDGSISVWHRCREHLPPAKATVRIRPLNPVQSEDN
jgi:hypothetical protein